MTITYEFIGAKHVRPVNSPTQREFLSRHGGDAWLGAATLIA